MKFSRIQSKKSTRVSQKRENRLKRLRLNKELRDLADKLWEQEERLEQIELEVELARKVAVRRSEEEQKFRRERASDKLSILKTNIDSAYGTIQKMVSPKCIRRAVASETKKARDGRIIHLECAAGCEDFFCREVGRYCVRRYELERDVFVDVSYKVSDDDLRNNHSIWKALHADLIQARVYVWTLQQSPCTSAGVRAAITKVMVVGEFRKQFRALSNVTVNWWDSLAICSLADVLQPRQLLTKLQYESQLPMHGWRISRKQKNAVRGVVVFNVRERTLSVLTDDGLLKQVGDVQGKDFQKSFVVECDVVVHALRVTPIRLVRVYQPQRQDKLQDRQYRLEQVQQFLVEKLEGLVNVTQYEHVIVPTFRTDHSKQLCSDVKLYAQAIAHDQAMPPTTKSEQYITGGHLFIYNAKQAMNQASYDKTGEERVKAVLEAADQYIKNANELHGNAIDFVRETVDQMMQKPLTSGVIFVSPDCSQVSEWENQENAEFEFLLFKKENDSYVLTVAVDQDIAGEKKLNIPKAHRFIEEYFGKTRVSAGLVPVRFRPFWRQVEHFNCDEFVSQEDLDKKLVKLRWNGLGWTLVSKLGRLGLGMKYALADIKWSQIQSGKTPSAFWQPSQSVASAFVVVDQLEALKQKLVTGLSSQACVLDLGTTSARHYLGNKADDVIFVAKSDKILETLSHERQNIVQDMTAKSKAEREAVRDGQTQQTDDVKYYPRMTGFVYRRERLAEDVKVLYGKQVNFVYCNLAHSFLTEDFADLRSLAHVVQQETARFCLLFIDGSAVHEQIFQRYAIKPGCFFATGQNNKVVFTRYYTEETVTENQLVNVSLDHQDSEFTLVCPDKIKQKMSDSGFSLIEEGHLGSKVHGVPPEFRMLARLHVYQIYQISRSA